jgi:hypothetical protein
VKLEVESVVASNLPLFLSLFRCESANLNRDRIRYRNPEQTLRTDTDFDTDSDTEPNKLNKPNELNQQKDR